MRYFYACTIKDGNTVYKMEEIEPIDHDMLIEKLNNNLNSHYDLINIKVVSTKEDEKKRMTIGNYICNNGYTFKEIKEVGFHSGGSTTYSYYVPNLGIFKVKAFSGQEAIIKLLDMETPEKGYPQDNGTRHEYI